MDVKGKRGKRRKRRGEREREAGAKSATESAKEPASVVGVTFGELVNCSVG